MTNRDRTSSSGVDGRAPGPALLLAQLATLVGSGLGAVVILAGSAGGSGVPALAILPAISGAVAAVAVVRSVRRPAAANAALVNAAAAASTEPVFGSMGLLSGTLAEARLAAEMERARYADRPLSVLRFALHVSDLTLSAPDRQRLVRAVARTVEAISHPLAVPFARAEGEFGVILPETPGSDADEYLDRVCRAMETTPVTVGPARERRMAGHLAIILAGRATFGAHATDAHGLLEAARPRSRAVLWLDAATQPRPDAVPVTTEVRIRPATPTASTATRAAPAEPAPRPLRVLAMGRDGSGDDPEAFAS